LGKFEFIIICGVEWIIVYIKIIKGIGIGALMVISSRREYWKKRREKNQRQKEKRFGGDKVEAGVPFVDKDHSKSANFRAYWELVCNGVNFINVVRLRGGDGHIECLKYWVEQKEILEVLYHGLIADEDSFPSFTYFGESEPDFAPEIGEIERLVNNLELKHSRK